MSQLAQGFNRIAAANSPRLSLMADWLIDLIFPPVCGCGRVDFGFCDDCLQELERFPLESRAVSSEPLNVLASTGTYDGILGQAIRAFKYDGVTSLDRHLADRLKRVFAQNSWAVDLIIPVPLAEKRLNERGYNQSEILSDRLSEFCGIPCRSDFMSRIRETDQQARLSSAQRAANVRNAFEASEAVKGQAILLIDDVVTTGSTLNECARAILGKGARTVYGLTVGRA